MVFPRINTAINATLLYYNINHISSEINHISGKIIRGQVLDYEGKTLPSWDDAILKLQAGMDKEILQIINLNYPHVHGIVLEKLRVIINNPPFDTVQKEQIENSLKEFNESEKARLIRQHGKGFSKEVDLSYLPQYYLKVEKALDNFKRIVNTYLKLYDAGKLPVAYPAPSYLQQDTPPVIKDINTKLMIDISTSHLATLFRVLHEEGIIASQNKSEIFRFASENFELKSGEKISTGTFSNKFYTPDPKSQTYWSTFFRKWVDKVKKISIQK